MGQFQNVPGPSQADFNTLSEQIATLFPKSNITTVSGTTDASGNAEGIAYPTGFTKSNCFVIGVHVSISGYEYNLDARFVAVTNSNSGINAYLSSTFANCPVTLLVIHI